MLTSVCVRYATPGQLPSGRLIQFPTEAVPLSAAKRQDMRGRANTAKLLADNPTQMRLRKLEVRKRFTNPTPVLPRCSTRWNRRGPLVPQTVD